MNKIVKKYIRIAFNEHITKALPRAGAQNIERIWNASLKQGLRGFSRETLARAIEIAARDNNAN